MGRGERGGNGERELAERDRGLEAIAGGLARQAAAAGR
jgi:hypothetical protein